MSETIAAGRWRLVDPETIDATPGPATFDGALGSTLEAGFLSVAAGTFVYVATFDILRDEFPAPGGRLAKWLVLSLGVGAMSLLALWS